MKQLNDSHIKKIKSEMNDSYSNDDLYNISSHGADLSFRELISVYEEEELLKLNYNENKALSHKLCK